MRAQDQPRKQKASEKRGRGADAASKTPAKTKTPLCSDGKPLETIACFYKGGQKEGSQGEKKTKKTPSFGGEQHAKAIESRRKRAPKGKKPTIQECSRMKANLSPAGIGGRIIRKTLGKLFGKHGIKVVWGDEKNGPMRGDRGEEKEGS